MNNENDYKVNVKEDKPKRDQSWHILVPPNRRTKMVTHKKICEDEI